jgi:hypothetical protein
MMWCTKIYNPWIIWWINCNKIMMITFLRSIILFLLFLGSFRNEISKVVMLNYLCHKIDLLIHACRLFMIWFIETSALISLLLILFGFWIFFGTWRILEAFGISLLFLLSLLYFLFGFFIEWRFSILYGECMCFGFLN